MGLSFDQNNLPLEFRGEMERNDHRDTCALTIYAITGELDATLTQSDPFGTEETHYINSGLAQIRQQTFMVGRIASRRALHILGTHPSASKGIGIGVFGQPIPYGTDHSLSIAHTEKFVTALAFPRGHPMGIDIERIQPEAINAVQSVLSKGEQDIINSAPQDAPFLHFLTWSARESLSKVLLCGLMSSAHVLTVKHFEQIGPNHWTGHYTHFHQWAFDAWHWDDCVFVITRPKNTRLKWSKISPAKTPEIYGKAGQLWPSDEKLGK
jgi:4'-phosphopantetheinyl transferase EntD